MFRDRRQREHDLAEEQAFESSQVLPASEMRKDTVQFKPFINFIIIAGPQRIVFGP